MLTMFAKDNLLQSVQHNLRPKCRLSESSIRRCAGQGQSLSFRSPGPRETEIKSRSRGLLPVLLVARRRGKAGCWLKHQRAPVFGGRCCATMCAPADASGSHHHYLFRAWGCNLIQANLLIQHRLAVEMLTVKVCAGHSFRQALTFVRDY